MKITNSLAQEIKNQFLQEWEIYKENNLYEDDDLQTILETFDSFKEEWPQEHQDYYDAIIEETDSLDEVQYLTDQLDYPTYQEAELMLSDFIDNINKEGIDNILEAVSIQQESTDTSIKYYIYAPKSNTWVYFVTKIDINNYRKSDVERWGLLNYPGDKNKIYSVRLTKSFSKAKSFSSKEEAEEIALEPIFDFEHNRSSRLQSFKQGALQVLSNEEAEAIINKEINEKSNEKNQLVNNAKNMVDKAKPYFDGSNEVVPGISNDDLKRFIDALSNVTTIKQLDNLKGRFNADTFDSYIDDSLIIIEDAMNKGINQKSACDKEIKNWLTNFDKFILTVQDDIREQI